MILGLTLALIQKPHNFKQHLNELLAMIDEKDGYIGDGAFYVSYLTPGIAEILRSFARIEGLRYDMIPDPVRRGFSTSELSVAFAKVGYRLHLHALLVMLELELIELDRTKMRKPRSVVRNIKNITQPFVPKSLSLLRLEYVSQIMIEKEPGNLFFKYLRIKTARALSSHWRHQLMGELLRMPQFPTDRLPNNCDRKADYLWQRAEKEYAPDPRNQCAKIYSGVDFVWLAALLLESD